MNTLESTLIGVIIGLIIYFIMLSLYGRDFFSAFETTLEKIYRFFNLRI